MELLKRLYDNLPSGQRQFLTFSFVGGIGFLVDSGIMLFLYHVVGVNFYVARFFSMFVFAMTVTFALNRTLTFRARESGSIMAQYLRFALVNMTGNLSNYALSAVLVATVPLVARYPILALIAGTAVGLLFNFTGSKYFAFKRA